MSPDSCFGNKRGLAPGRDGCGLWDLFGQIPIDALHADRVAVAVVKEVHPGLYCQHAAIFPSESRLHGRLGLQRICGSMARFGYSRSRWKESAELMTRQFLLGPPCHPLKGPIDIRDGLVAR